MLALTMTSICHFYLQLHCLVKHTQTPDYWLSFPEWLMVVLIISHSIVFCQNTRPGGL